MIEFLRQICKIAKAQPRVVLAIDFEPDPNGLKLTLRYKDSP